MRVFFYEQENERRSIMFRLVEITRVADNETQALREYASEVEASGELHYRLGSAMKDETTQVKLLLLLNNIGEVVESGSHFKTHEVEETIETENGETETITTEVEYEVSPRLIDVKVTDSEVGNIAKYDTNLDVTANYHSKLGAAKKSADVKAIMLRGIDGKGNQLEYTYWVRPATVPSES